MNKRLPSLLFFGLLLTTSLGAQTQFWSDNFEDAGSPSSGTRTLSVAEFISCSSPTFSYFKRTTGTELSPIVFTGFANSKFFAAMDIDRGAGCGANNTISAGQSITWTGINISGKSGLSFRGLFGANSSAVFQGLPFLPSTDTMAVSYRIDGGAWTKIVGVHCNDNTGTGGTLGFDLNGDRIGDGGTYTLGNNLSEIIATIPGTGTTLDLRFNIFVNNSQPGAMAFDNFRLYSSSVLPVTWAAFNVRKQNNSVELDWSTASEQNTKDFTVQHKTETGAWHDLAILAAAGSSGTRTNYSYSHASPVNGNNYYRIQQTDIDGQVSYTDIRTVRFTASSTILTVLENPVVNGTLKVRLSQPSDLVLYDPVGRVIWQQQQANGVLSIPVNAGKGLYLLKSGHEVKKVAVR